MSRCAPQDSTYDSTAKQHACHRDDQLLTPLPGPPGWPDPSLDIPWRFDTPCPPSRDRIAGKGHPLDPVSEGRQHDLEVDPFILQIPPSVCTSFNL